MDANNYYTNQMTGLENEWDNPGFYEDQEEVEVGDFVDPEADESRARGYPSEDRSWAKFLLISTVLACLVVGGILSRLGFLFTPVKAASGTQSAFTNSADAQTLPGLVGRSTPEAAVSSGTIEGSSECLVSDQFPKKVLRWCDLISEHASQRGLPPDLVAALILQESGGNPAAYSQSGAVGLMQVMPKDGIAASFMCVGGPCFANRPSSSELKDPRFNISYGTKMLAGLVGRSGNLREGLKSYGPMDVGYYYADKVMGLYQRYGK